MGWFIKFDMWLITCVFEPIAWRVEYHYGKNNFWLARQLIMFVAVFQTALFFKSLGLIIIPMWLMFAFSFQSVIRVHESTVRRSPQHLNYWKPRWQIRLVMYCLSIFMLSTRHYSGWFDTACEVLFQVSMILIFYFLSCNPLPPKWEPPKRVRVGALAFRGT